jgi:hypothetical protein
MFKIAHHCQVLNQGTTPLVQRCELVIWCIEDIGLGARSLGLLAMMEVPSPTFLRKMFS